MLSLIFVVLITQLFAFPNLYSNCNPNTYVAGQAPVSPSLNTMGEAAKTWIDATGNNCKLEGLPTEFNPCFTYKITVKSTPSKGHVFAVTTPGTLAASPGSSTSARSGTTNCRNTGDFAVASSSYLWTAPASGSPQKLAVLCGEQNANMLVVSSIISVNSTPNFTIPSSCPSVCQGPGCNVSSSGTTASARYISLFFVIACTVFIGI